MFSDIIGISPSAAVRSSAIVTLQVKQTTLELLSVFFISRCGHSAGFLSWHSPIIITFFDKSPIFIPPFFQPCKYIIIKINSVKFCSEKSVKIKRVYYTPYPETSSFGSSNGLTANSILTFLGSKLTPALLPQGHSPF